VVRLFPSLWFRSVCGPADVTIVPVVFGSFFAITSGFGRIFAFLLGFCIEIPNATAAMRQAIEIHQDHAGPTFYHASDHQSYTVFQVIVLWHPRSLGQVGDLMNTMITEIR
jgi:hypothetical protein